MFWLYFWLLLGSFGSGFVTGGYAVYSIWDVNHKNNVIASLKLDNQNFRKAAGIAAEIDEESEEAREKNASIVRKMYELQSRPPETKEIQYVIKPEIIQIPASAGKKRPKAVAIKPGTGRPLCIDADSMRLLGTLN